MGSVNVLSQLRLRPRRTLLSAVVLLCVPSWAIPGVRKTHRAAEVSDSESRDNFRIPLPKAPCPASAVVVGIGDSVTSATVCGCTGFVESYAAHLPAQWRPRKG